MVLIKRRTVLIGLFVLCMTFAEGTGNDWLGVAAIDGYGASAALGSLAYVLFVASMTAGRWFGPARRLDPFGRVLVLRAGALFAMAGVLVVVVGPSLATALIGIILWGLGAALGFPTGMSAAADEPRYAAGRVSTVATLGYVAFLAGPSLIGLIGNETGVFARPDRDRRPVGARVRGRRFDTSARGRTGRRRAELTYAAHATAV